MIDPADILSTLERLERKLDALAAQRPELLTTEQAAELAGVRPKTIRAWIASGLQAERRGRRLFVKRSALEGWAAGGDGRPTPALLSSLTVARD